MKFPIYKKDPACHEMHCILDHDTMSSVQNNHHGIFAIGIVENSDIIKRKLKLGDSNEKEFYEALRVVTNKIDVMSDHPNLQ